jgi:large subunit ribosomal protein L21
LADFQAIPGMFSPNPPFKCIFFQKTGMDLKLNPYLCRPKFGNFMLAIVKIAGQQFKVKAGDSLYVPHIEGKAGDSVEFAEVLMTDSNGNVVLGSDVKAVVKAEIISDLIKGDKVIAFKMKRRKGFRKKHGHRTQYTHIKVTAIA